ncbi:MAG: Gp49 family protein [Mizugakiibacter sp.]|uniref:Gp49 family protein n=1 Tax=Mizugakiibacter sp. TaxID=1972610 RepID=UPI00320FC44E
MSSGTSSSSSGGIGILGLLGVVFVTLKLLGVINWSWWWVTAPFWGGIALVLAVFLIFAPIRIESCRKPASLPAPIRQPFSTVPPSSRKRRRRIVGGEAMSAPRVTQADIEAAISEEFYFTARDGVTGARYNEVPRQFTGIDTSPPPLSLLTFCVLVLTNGFTVTGESACVSPENFDAELGRKYAREKAVEKLWTLLGFDLKERLHRFAERAPRPHDPPIPPNHHPFA